MRTSEIGFWESYVPVSVLFVKIATFVVSWTLVTINETTAADPDLQLWMPIQIVHPISDEWVVSMQTETRLKDDITEFSELVLKPGVHYHCTPSWVISSGYKHINKYKEANEQDLWQEITLNKTVDDLILGYQVRIEERLIDDISGILPRLRFLMHASHPIGDSPSYLTGFGAVRFNLDDKGTGPVSGFEQSRIYTGLGHHFGEHVQFEVGYLWRYEEERSGDDKSDHAIHLQLVINTKAKSIKKPTSRDRYR